MKTRLLAMLAVFAMVFAGAAIIAQDNTSDAVAAFDVDSPIDAYARTADKSPATGTSHAIHYNTTGGMLAIVLSDAAYQALTTPDVAIQVEVTGGDNAGTKVYDPISKAQTVHINMGILGTTSTVVSIANHGTADFSGALSFTLGAITDASFNLDDGSQTGTPDNISGNKPTSLARNLVPAYTNTNYTMIGWSTSASGDAVLDNGATLESILMNAANIESVYTLYAIWSNQSFTVAFEFNKPTFIGNMRYVNTANEAGTTDTENAAAVAAVADSSGTTTGSLTMTVAGENYVLSETYYLQGYTFAGWYTKQVGGERITLSSATTEPTKASIQEAFGTANLAKGGTYTIYAHWTAVKYTVTYDATKLAIGFTIGDSLTDGWNIQTIAYDESAALMTIPQLDNAAGKNKLTPNTGYIFSHWELSTDSSVDYEAGAMVSNLNTDWTTATVTLYPVFDYVVTVSGLITGVDFQPQSRDAGYEYMIDGDEATPTYTFKLVYDNLLYDATAVSATGGTAGALGGYTDGGKTCTISSITGPVAITLTLSTGYYKVTVAGDSTGQYVLDTDYTINWTKTVPNGKEGLLTVTSAKVGTSSTVYTIGTETTGFEIVPITNSLYKIKDNREDTSTVATVAITATKADATGGNVSNLKFTMESLTTTAATAYLRAEGYEVPSGTITVTGTAYKTEGGVTVFVGLGSTYASQYVKVPGVHSGDSPFGTDNKEPGTGYQEYQIKVSNPTNYNLYSAKLTFTPSSGGSAVSTVYAI